MNKGFNRYFKESYKASYKALKKKDNYFRYLLFSFIELLSLIFFFIKPIIDLASVRLVKSIKIEKRVILSKTIETGDNPKSYWTSVITVAMKILLFIGILLIYAVVIGVLYILGFLIYSIIQDSDYMFLIFVFCVPALIALAIFIIVCRYLTVNTAYIVDTNPNLGASKVLYASIASLKETGKRTLFLNDLVHLLIFLTIVVIGTLLTFVCGLLPEEAGIPCMVLVLLVFVGVSLFFIPLLTLSHKMVKVSLFDDIVIDKYAIKQRISGIRMIEFNKKAKMPIEDRLAAVFDNEEQLDLEAKLFMGVPANEETESIQENTNIQLQGFDNFPLDDDDIFIEADSIESDGE